MSKSEVKAVGFAGFSPEVMVLFADHSSDQLHIFPPKDTSGNAFLFEPDGRRQVVLLKALDKLSGLEPYASRIYRLIVFADASDLQALGIPILDMETDETGKFVACQRQPRDRLLQRIEEEAVSIPVDKPVTATKRARQNAQQAAAYSGPTFREQLRSLRESLNPTKKSFSFINDVGVPAILRLMLDTTRDDFKAACKNMIEAGGLPQEEVKLLFKWVEGIEGGIGPELGKAVEAFLYEDSGEDLTQEEIAGKYGVDAKDLQFVANSYARLADDQGTEDIDE